MGDVGIGPETVNNVKLCLSVRDKDAAVKDDI